MNMPLSPEQRIVEHLKTLIAIPTPYPPGESVQMAAYISRCLRAAGYEVETLACKAGLDNVVARMGSGAPSLVFNTHIDTVGAGDLDLWDHPPFEAHIADGKVFGLGAANCKGSGAVQLWLAEEIARCGGPERGEVVFTFVTDEESLDKHGMAYLRACGAVKPDMLLLGAPTDNALIVAERGVLWAQVTTFGRPAHAGEPEAGDSAISRMLTIATRLEAELGEKLASRIRENMRSTFNMGIIRGGDNNNVVASKCLLQIDRRLLPTETVDDAFSEICDIVARVCERSDLVQVEPLRGTNGFIGNSDGVLVSALEKSIKAHTGQSAEYTSAIGVSDGRYFADDGIEIVNFGPGIGSEGHASNESVSLSKLVESAYILHSATLDIVGVKTGNTKGP